MFLLFFCFSRLVLCGSTRQLRWRKNAVVSSRCGTVFSVMRCTLYKFMVFMRTALNECNFICDAVRFNTETETNTKAINNCANMNTFDPDQDMMLFIARNENWIGLNLVFLVFMFIYNWDTIQLDVSYSVQGCVRIKSKQLNRLRLHNSISNWIFVSSSFFSYQQSLGRTNK